MENRTATTAPSRPFDGAEKQRHTEPVAEPGYHAAGQPAAEEAHVTEPAVATDGQFVEAGYGHGV